MQSHMSHQFSQVPQAEIPRSKFDRSHGVKTALDAGYIVPVFLDEALPGDTFNLRMSAFGRLATPIYPIMDNMYLDSFFFAVPYRLVWDNWQKFNGEQVDPGDSTDYVVPEISAPTTTGWTIGSLGDYFGLPTDIDGFSVNSLFFRAYNLIYNEWFRDQNLQDSVVVDRDDGPDSPADYVLLRRGKRHDYFTSCLPWPQKGPAVDLPLGTSAPIKTTEYLNIEPVNMDPSVGFGVGTDTGRAYFAMNGENYSSDRALYTDLTNATAATINQLRQAFQIQKLYERDARGGTRYTEIIRAHFGVISPDARLQRPEYLGGGSTPIMIKQVPQTSSTDGTSPQGNLAAFGTASINSHGFTKSFTEHTLVLGFVNIRADLTYQQGLNRMWSRQTRWDFYWPALAHIGEQAVFNKEIMLQATSADDDVFGYQERFAEYRYKPSIITNILRSSAAGSLDAWHLAQEFATLPALNATFIVDNPPVDRVIAVPSQPHMILDAFFKYICARPMPVYSVPGLIDHF